MNYLRPLFILIFCSVPSVTFAQITITEIMYDPEGADTNREWVEVHNSGDDIVILGGLGNTWRLYEESTSGVLNKRILNFESGASTLTLPHNAYAVIAKNASAFRQDFPEHNGLLFLSALSLTNSEGRVLTFRDANGIENSSPLLYTPLPEADGTGASLQLQEDGQWIAGLPTPGEINTREAFSLHEEELNEGDIDDDFLQLESNWPFTGEELYLDAGDNRRVFIDEQVIFNGRIRFKNGDEVRRRSPSWAFGDGEGDKGARTTHSYKYPGVYRVVLRAKYEGRLYQDSFLIHVIDVREIAIGNYNSDSVELINESNYEVELSNWALGSHKETKKLAEGTFILPLSSISVPFVSHSNPVALYNSMGNLVNRTALAPESLSNNEIYERMIQELERMIQELERMLALI
jgi:hypothetical protein